ncbi:MAG: PAS domain S-box protein [Actinomycetota bacterium]|nr:PAS domain S-box protein [Actinomycetota bacterium]
MPPADVSPSPLDLLLDYLKLSRGFDFTGYKRSSLERRIAKRIEAVGVEDYVAYRDILEVRPDEFAHLFNTILINVTSFFRDAPVWEHLAEHTIPGLLTAVGGDGPIRAWCAGCSSGEEAYTVAMLLAETLGEREYLERVKIYATDIDEEALNQARVAVYSDKAVETVPPVLLEKYFERTDRSHAFRKDMRRAVIFGRNDLVQDAPISRIDLLTCRNTLMYFNAETQAQILNRLNFALNEWGTLLLGKSEMLITHSELFAPQDLKRRLFARVPRTTARDRPTSPPPIPPDLPARSDVRDLAFDSTPAAQVVVDAGGTIVAVNRQARSLFGLGHADLGRPLRDLELSYRPVDLRSNLELAVLERRTIVLGSVEHTVPSGDQRTFDVHITPIVSGAEAAGATVAFADVTLQQHLRAELETSKAELENAYEELQSTVEELETTNEELQSTNEELETTNEELQSTNEELETMNAELQSTNEELETINDEIRKRTRELDEVNLFLETILATMETAVVVVDGQLIVQMWNGQAEELFGLRLADVQDQALLGLGIGLPVGDLADPLREVLRGTVEREVVDLDATNRRGRAFRSRVTVLPLEAGPEGTYGAVLLIEAVHATAEPSSRPVADATG